MQSIEEDKDLLEEFAKLAASGEFEKKKSEEKEPKKSRRMRRRERPFNLYNHPVRYLLTDEEMEEISHQLTVLIRYYDDAINIAKKHLNHLENEGLNDEEWIVYKVRRGGVKKDHGLKESYEAGLIELLKIYLNVFEESKNRFLNPGIKYFIDVVERFGVIDIGNLGLSRGFSEYDWGDLEDELSDAIRKIENYYSNI